MKCPKCHRIRYGGRYRMRYCAKCGYDYNGYRQIGKEDKQK